MKLKSHLWVVASVALALMWPCAAMAATAPTATSNAATNITATSATINGTVEPNGAVTRVDFGYGTNYIVRFDVVEAGVGHTIAANAGTTMASANITGLTCNTRYEFFPFAQNTSGTSNSPLGVFTTAACPIAPTGVTTAATNITATSATLNGTVTPNGALTTVSFGYGTNYIVRFDVVEAGVGRTIDPDAPATAVSANITGLTCNTRYESFVFASNTSGISNAPLAVFTTAACPIAPTGVTTAATNITATSATLNGTVTPNGALTTVSFGYGTNYIVRFDVVEAGVGRTIDPGAPATAVSANITGLTCNTRYESFVFASNTSGISNAPLAVFTTAACPIAPTGVTTAATNITATSATLNGTVTPNGALTTVSFGYGIDIYVHLDQVIAGVGRTIDPDAPATAVSANITGLTCNTRYQSFVYAVNTSGYSNAPLAVFTTAACPIAPTAPTGTTSAATNITATSATLNGTVVPNDALTTVRFRYGIDVNVNVNLVAVDATVGGTIAANAGVTVVSANIAGLTCNTRYQYATSASSTSGNSNANLEVFTTAACPIVPTAPTGVTTAATNITATSATLNGTMNPNGALTTVDFMYATNIAVNGIRVAATVGHTVAAQAGVTPVSVGITSLTCGTRYEYVVIGTNSVGPAVVQLVNFTTAACPVAPNPTPTPTPTPTTPGATTAIPTLTLFLNGFTFTPNIINLGAGDGPAFTADLVNLLSTTLGQQLQFVEQTQFGTVVLRGFNGGNLAFVPVSFQSSDARANGIYPTGNGQYQVVRNGQSITIIPALVHVDQLMALFPGLVAVQADTGVITATLNGVRFVLVPGVNVVLQAATGTAQLVLGSDGFYHFIDAQGNDQVLYPALGEPSTLRNILLGLDAAATLSVQLDGTAKVVVSGKPYTLVPDQTLDTIPADRVGQASWQEGALRYRFVGVLPQSVAGTSQGFVVKP